MLNRLKRVNNILRTGVNEFSVSGNAKYILRTNFIAFTIQVLIIPYSIFFYFLGAPIHAFILAGVFFTFFLVYALNKRGQHTGARLWLIFMILVCVYFFGASFGKNSSVHYLFFVFITLPFLIFELKEKLPLVLSIAVFILTFYAMEFEWLPLPVVMKPQSQHIMHISMLSLVLAWLTVNFLYFELTNKQAEDTLKSQNALLQAKNNELEQFAYIASHDLQEPLLTVNNFSELLKEDFGDKLGDSGNLYIKYITASAGHMSQLVKGLMEYGRLGKAPEKTTVDCKAAVIDAMKGLAASIENKKAVIQYNGLPIIRGYKTEIRLLFQNLIGNAIKFSQPGETPQIKISAQHTGGSWLFSVSDNGIGIKEKHIEKIFNIFQRLHKREEYEGTGIGLAHCRKIVELHGGKIWANSALRKGSTFYFTIPDR